MDQANHCPDRTRLQEMLAGHLPQLEQDSLSAHVEQCESCQRTLDQLAGSSWDGKARELAGDQTEHSGADILAARPATDAATQAESIASDNVDVLPYLSRSENPKHLGRLGHYEIVELLGKGGFGTVFRAFDTKLHRIVAIKVLAPELAASGTARKRFIREAQAAAAVKNDHVVAIHNVDDDHQPPYLVMEYIDGVTLQGKLDKQGALDIKEILRIGMQMAEGLAAAHKQGLVHRDIKPANILLENGVQRVKITDFGLARAMDDASVTQSGVIAGTPMYMSPEQAEGLPLDHRSDLFSLGTVLYVMCTGRPPFPASGTMGILKRVVEETPRPIHEINPEIPTWLGSIIAQLHAKKPEDRYQTAREVADLLGQRLADVQQGRTIIAPAAPALPSPAASAKAAGTKGTTHRKLRWLATAALVAIIAALAWFLHPHPGLYLQNSGYLWISGKNSVPVTWTLTRDGKVVKDIKGLGFQGFSLPPGEYELRATNLQTDRICTFDMQKKALFSGGAERQRSDHLKFAVTRGEYVRIDVAVIEAVNAKIADASDGWDPLFNGVDLQGWETHPEPAGRWEIKNGILTCSGLQSYLFSKRNYDNFHLRAEMKINADGDSGICVRSTFASWMGGINGRLPLGYEANVSGKFDPDTGYNTGSLVAPGSLAGVYEKLVQPDEWLTLEIVAQGDNLRVLINGKATANVAAPRSADPVSRIALQHSGPATVVHFRKIEIQELPPGTINDKNGAKVEFSDLTLKPAGKSAAPGWVSLFNGTDLTNWEVNQANEGVWKVDRGVLVGTPKEKPPYFIYSRRGEFYSNYHLRLQGHVNAGGEAGVYLRIRNPGAWKGIAIKLGHRDKGELSVVGHNMVAPNWSLAGSKRFLQTDHWFTLDLIADGPRFEARLDGIVVGKHELTAEEFARHDPSGAIALEVGAKSTFSVRSVELKELPAIIGPKQRKYAAVPRLRKTIDNKNPVGAVAFNADGSAVIAGGESVTFFDTSSGDVLHDLKLPSRITAPFSLSQDRKTLALVHKDAAMLVEIPARTIPLQSKTGFVFSAALSPNADTLAYSADKELLFYDRASGNTTNETRHGKVWSLKYSPDGRYLVGVAHSELLILDAKSRDVVAKQSIGAMGLTDLSSNSQYVVASGAEDGKPAFYVYALPDLRLIFKQANLANGPVSVTFAPDGNHLAFGSVNGTVQIWNIAERKQVASCNLGATGLAITFVAFSPDGKTLATGCQNRVQLWDLMEDSGSTSAAP